MLRLKLDPISLRLVKREIKKRFDRIERRKPQIGLAAGEEFLSAVNRETPERTGFLRSRNRLEKTRNGAAVTNDAEYATTVEFKDKPFFRMALKARRKQAIRAAGREVKKQL